MAYKNTAVTVCIYAWDSVNGTPKTGDAANITTRGVGDGAEFTPAAPAVTEMDSTNLKGVYKVALAAGENNYSHVLLGGVSSTAGIVIQPVQWTNEANANLAQILGTAVTETAGQIAAGFKKLFDVAAPVLTLVSVNQTGDNFARIGAAGAGLTALGDTRIANLDATISSRTKPADTQARVTLVDTVTTYTGNTPQTGDSFARIGALGAGLTALASQSSLSALIATVGAAGAGLTAADDAILVAIAALENLPAGAAMTLTSAERLAIADALRARQLTEPATYPAIGVAPTLQQILFMIHGLLADFVFTGTTQSIKRLDTPGTEAMSYEIDSETVPTQHVRVG